VARDSQQTPATVAATRIRYLLTGAQYLLLSYTLRQSIAGTPDAIDRNLLEICRVALLLFSLSTLHERPPHLDYGIQLASNLCRVMHNEYRGDESSVSAVDGMDLRLWAIVSALGVIGIDNVPVRNANGGTWNYKLRHIFIDTLEKYPCDEDNSYPSLRTRIGQYPWISGVYDDTLRKLYSS
jgi:hypothetical protein